MKITEEIKNNTTFLYGKLQGLNNREAARLYTIVPEGIGTENSPSQKVLSVYINFCKEPNIDKKAYEYVKGEGESQKQSRSKIVMEYEKHRKLFLSISKARYNQAIKDKIDAAVHKIAGLPQFESLTEYTLEDKKSILSMAVDMMK
jgi:tRNA threonylcarbamoyladenosine modification (KEOPS) complex  Pcc1 subunit